MAVPFGFSAGDFMAAIHLVHKVTIALRETDGASSQYNQTIIALQGLEGLLRSVQRAYSADVDPQQLDNLQLLGHECYILLSKFLSRVKVLEPSLGNLGTRNDRIIDRTKRAVRKVHWGFQVKKELSELTAALQLRIPAISMQLLLISFERPVDARLNPPATTTFEDNIVQTLRDLRLEAENDRNAQTDLIKLLHSKFEDQNAAQNAAQTQILQLLADRALSPQSSGSPPQTNGSGIIKSAQDTIRQSIQVILSFFRAGVNTLLLKLWIALPVVQHILRTLQTLPLLISIPISDSILFEDALGRITHLPYVYFRHHAVFMARLRCEFKDVPGEQKVLQEQFRIFRQKDFDKLLTEDNWESAVSPGSKVAMSILLDSYDSEGDTCPRCGTVKAGMNAEELSQCTVCGLRWVLQKFDPPQRSPGAERVHESTLGPPAMQDIYKVTENEPSDSSAFSPDPSEAELPLVDDEDIKSFKMVHILSQNDSTDTEAASSIPLLLKRVFPSRKIQQPIEYTHGTANDAVMEVMQAPAKPKRGYIYMGWHEGCSQILRIGLSTKDINGELWMLKPHCKEHFIFDPQLYIGTQMEVPFVSKVKELMQTELRDYYVRMECNGCHVAYHQWFYVSKEHGMKVFQKWRDWILREPYMLTSYGEWVLKPSFFAQMREMSRPLAMKN